MENDPQALFQRALMAAPEQALPLWQALLEAMPAYPNAAYRLGMLLHARGDTAGAESAYRHELGHSPQAWACRANLAQLLTETDRPEAALAELSLAGRSCPDTAFQAELLQLQARLELRLQQPQAALQSLMAAAERHDSALIQRDLARLMLRLGETAGAGRHYRRALRLQPDDRLQREIGEHLVSVQQFPEALSVLTHVLATGQLPPAEAALVMGQIANAHQELNQPQLALEWYDRALALAPRASLRLARALVLPVVYAHSEDVLYWRTRMERELAALPAHSLDQPLEHGVLPFYAPYQGYNDRPLMQRFASRLAEVPSVRLPPKRRLGRMRLGCVSHFFYRHSVMHCFVELLLALGQAPFELHLIAASSLLEDELTAELRQGSASWTRLQGQLDRQLEQIQALDLDAILFTDTGLDPHTYTLARFRHAPLQLLLPGQPITSGLTSFDGFVSDHLTEVPHAAEHYTEPLWLLSRPPTIYRMPEIPARFKSRGHLGLPEGRIYLCPMQAFKLHPQMDQALLKILSEDRQGIMLLLDLTPNRLIQAVVSRLQAQLTPQQAQRIRVAPRYDSAEFLSLLTSVEVVLESFPFSSWNTLMAAFAVGTPVVTLPGEFLRSRFCLSLYRQMGLASAPIAANEQEYAELALQLAHHRQRRKRLHQEILQQRPQIFGHRAVGDELRERILADL